MRALAACMRVMPTDIRRFDAWWNSLYERIGGGGYAPEPELDAKWPPGLQPPVRIHSGFLAKLDLQDWLERRVYFSGRYYQYALEPLLQHLLSPGDTWIDIGANIGLVTLAAAAQIGPSGRGYAFEPNPRVFRRLADHVSINGIANFTCSNVALGASAGKATLSVPKHTGQGSLVRFDDAGLDTVEVPVVRADDALAEGHDDVVVIKIDVEGYEMQVLEGMERLLRHRNTALIIEVLDELLQRAGTTSRAVLDLMASFGFAPYEFDVKTSRLAKTLELTALDAKREHYSGDLLFLRNESVFSSRLAGQLSR